MKFKDHIICVCLLAICLTILSGVFVHVHYRDTFDQDGVRYVQAGVMIVDDKGTTSYVPVFKRK